LNLQGGNENTLEIDLVNSLVLLIPFCLQFTSVAQRDPPVFGGEIRAELPPVSRILFMHAFTPKSGLPSRQKRDPKRKEIYAALRNYGT
jgi:hypothetical protein